MTKSKTKLVRNLLISVALVFCFALLQNGVLFQFAGYNQYSERNIVSAAYENDITSALSNNNFANFGYSSTFPYSPNNWTASNTGASLDYLKHGVVDMSRSVFDTKHTEYGLLASDHANLPVTTDNFCLMINAGTAAVSFGYTTNSSVALSANSYYRVSVWVRTSASGRASVYLMGNAFNDLVSARLESRNTGTNWVNHTFMIATSAFSAENFSLGLWLGIKGGTGSQGFAMFDAVRIAQISESTFAAANESNVLSKVDLRTAPVLAGQDGFVTNGDFKAGSSGWTPITTNPPHQFAGNPAYSAYNGVINVASYSSNTAGTPDYSGPGTNFRSGHEFAWLINNRMPTTVGVKSADILIKQHGIYRLSVFVKSGELTGSAAGIKLSGKVSGSDDEQTFSSEFTGIRAGSSTVNATNGWTEYVFYVVGNPFADSNVNLEFWLGSSDVSTATGHVFFSTVSTQRVSHTQMKDGTSRDTNNRTLNMFNSTSENFTNGYFNFVNNQNNSISYPLLPASWTHDTDNVTQLNQIKSGVINTNAAHFEANKANGNYPANLTNPGRTPIQSDTSVNASNNALLIGNLNPQAQSFASSSGGLSANEHKLVSVMLRTQLSNSSDGAYIQVKTDTGMIITEFHNISSNAYWTTYNIYVRGNLFTNNLLLTLGLGTAAKPVMGYAFFDNATIETITAAEYQAANTGKITSLTSCTVTAKADFQSGSLSFSSGIADPLTGLFASTSYSGEFHASNGSQVTPANGVLDTAATTHPDYQKVGVPAVTNDPRVLMISSANDVYFSYTSNTSYSLSANSYYRLSVWVRTVGVRQLHDDSFSYDEDGNKLTTWGASISVLGIDQMFTAIDTKDYTHEFHNNNPWAENEFKEYVFLISTTESVNAKIMLALGSSNGLTTGMVFFSSVALTSMSELEMLNALSGYGDNLPDNVIHIANTDTKDSPDTGPTDPIPFDWLLLPTIIFGVALIVAIAGYAVRRLSKLRKNRTYVSTKYDRAQTLLKDVERRDMRATIEHKLKLLRRDLTDSKDYLLQEEAEYFRQMEAYNTAKEIAKSDPEITLEKLEDKYVKFDKYKLQLEDKIAGITDDIAALEYERDRLKRETDKAIKHAAEIEKPQTVKKKPTYPAKKK
ncbi:MAG: hypothetical protein FWE53_02180 [Firmicutes bacterium]|nr:hypothetical protein [Bacillota bacterium]